MSSHQSRVNELESFLVRTIDEGIRKSSDPQEINLLKHKKAILGSPQYQSVSSASLAQRSDFNSYFDRSIENDFPLQETQHRDLQLRNANCVAQNSKAAASGLQLRYLCTTDR